MHTLKKLTAEEIEASIPGVDVVVDENGLIRELILVDNRNCRMIYVESEPYGVGLRVYTPIQRAIDHDSGDVPKLSFNEGEPF